jgi:hypothetical protein
MIKVFYVSKRKDTSFVLYDVQDKEIEKWSVDPIHNPEGDVSDLETLEDILNHIEMKLEYEILTVNFTEDRYVIITRRR